MRIPMQSLAAFTGADFKSPGSLNYSNFLRATHFVPNDIREKAIAFKRAVFNVVFNNRDDHCKNFSVFNVSKMGNGNSPQPTTLLSVKAQVDIIKWILRVEHWILLGLPLSNWVFRKHKSSIQKRLMK